MAEHIPKIENRCSQRQAGEVVATFMGMTLPQLMALQARRKELNLSTYTHEIELVQFAINKERSDVASKNQLKLPETQ